jgi:monovalent cation:H+ antiporter-2, CPA2 family
MDLPFLFVNVTLALAAALLGGVVARLLRQPVILGYFLGGVLISEFTPGPVGDVHQLEVLADIGVAFLMFALGVEVSLSTLLSVGRVALLGGLVQIAASMAIGAGLAVLIGLSGLAAVFFGALVALSSTVVVIRLLADRGELAAPHGRIALGILIVQDLSVVPMMVVLPAFNGPTDGLVASLGLALVKAVAILVGTLAIGARVIPWVLTRVARAGAPDLFVLAIVTLALGTALVTAWAGLSIAFGAFLAGLVIAESELSHQVLDRIGPLRDAFITMFFVSVGMLLNPAYILGEAPLILAIAAAVLIAKGLVAGAVPLFFGYPLATATLVGASLAQIGEFSFVLARLGVDQGILSERIFGLTLAVAVVTIVLTPGALRLAGPLAGALGSRLGAGRAAATATYLGNGAGAGTLRDHVVVLGYGQLGQELVSWLERRGVPFVVVESRADLLGPLRARGIPTLAGDASSPQLLDQCELPRARVVAVTLPGSVAAAGAIRHVRGRNPDLDVVARAEGETAVGMLHSQGADEVVQPEFEAALEFVRHTLGSFAPDAARLEAELAARRDSYYRPAYGAPR